MKGTPFVEQRFRGSPERDPPQDGQALLHAARERPLAEQSARGFDAGQHNGQHAEPDEKALPPEAPRVGDLLMDLVTAKCKVLVDRRSNVPSSHGFGRGHDDDQPHPVATRHFLQSSQQERLGVRVDPARRERDWLWRSQELMDTAESQYDIYG